MSDSIKQKREARIRRRVRVRRKVKGTSERPRLTVFRSHRGIYAQVVDDTQGRTLVAAESRRAPAMEVPAELRGKCAAAYRTGRQLADLAKQQGVEMVVFDRGGYLYHGRVAALARGVRDGGIQF